jgi:hypothetical protein
MVELAPDRSAREATRGIGGSCGGYGDTGELEVKLALSGMRGDAKYSVGCIVAEWRAELLGPGEARAEALRLPWPGLR